MNLGLATLCVCVHLPFSPIWKLNIEMKLLGMRLLNFEDSTDIYK